MFVHPIGRLGQWMHYNGDDDVSVHWPLFGLCRIVFYSNSFLHCLEVGLSNLRAIILLLKHVWRGGNGATH